MAHRWAHIANYVIVVPAEPGTHPPVDTGLRRYDGKTNGAGSQKSLRAKIGRAC